MSYNVTKCIVLSSSLCISSENLIKARAFAQDGFPTSHPFGELPSLKQDAKGRVPLMFRWSGDWSGQAFNDGTLAKAVALTEGEAEVVLVWEGGDHISGIRIKGGIFEECDVRHVLVEKKGGPK